MTGEVVEKKRHVCVETQRKSFTQIAWKVSSFATAAVIQRKMAQLPTLPLLCTVSLVHHVGGNRSSLRHECCVLQSLC